jgi:predicted phage gp36 major capsid-like protein
MKTSETMARRLQSGAEKIKNELRETVESYKKRLEILGGIRRVHKKDGSDFQNRLKNFDFTKGGEFFLE